MKLEGLRQVLLRKTHDDSYLNTLIQHMSDEKLTEYVVESLSKMAQKKDFLGSHANHAEREFASKMDSDVEGAMLHDALSHHASKYRAALKAGRDDLATNHARQFRKLVSLGLRAQNHSNGQLNIEAPDIKPWERNAYTATKDGETGHQQKHYNTATKGFHTKAAGHDWMRKPPHWSYKGDPTAEKYKDQPYPMHDVKVNGKYLHIEDHEPISDYQPHEFDSHPVMAHVNRSDLHIKDEDRQKYIDEHHGWEEHPHALSWAERHEKMAEEDPEGYMARGSKPSMNAHHDFALPADHFPPADSAKPAAKPAMEVKTDTTPSSTGGFKHGDSDVHSGNFMDHIKNIHAMKPEHQRQMADWILQSHKKGAK